MTGSKPRRGSASAWLAAFWAGCVFTVGMALMVMRGSGGHLPAITLLLIRVVFSGLAAVGVVWAAAIVLRLRPATRDAKDGTPAEVAETDAERLPETVSV